jgi:hypothetical protein
MKSII